MLKGLSNKLFNKYGDTPKKILYTLGILALYKFLSMITMPGVSLNLLSGMTEQNSFWKTINVLSGGNVEKCSIFAAGIIPYINASIIMQLLSSNIGFDSLRRLRESPYMKELNLIKLNEYTQYLTVAIAIVHSTFYAMWVFNSLSGGGGKVFIPKMSFYLVTIPTVTAGTMASVWIANSIAKLGIGNGTSLVIFANVVSNLLNSFVNFFKNYQKGNISFISNLTSIIFMSTIFLLVILVESTTRELKVRYSGSSGRKVEHELALRVNNSGILPCIMASSIVSLPSIFIMGLNKLGLKSTFIDKLGDYLAYGNNAYYLLYCGFLAWFCLSHSDIVFNPKDIANALLESGAIIDKTRPGEATYKKLCDILKRLNYLAAIYLIIVCPLSEYFSKSLGIFFAGTQILILVNVVFDISRRISLLSYEERLSKLSIIKVNK